MSDGELKDPVGGPAATVKSTTAAPVVNATSAAPRTEEEWLALVTKYKERLDDLSSNIGEKGAVILKEAASEFIEAREQRFLRRIQIFVAFFVLLGGAALVGFGMREAKRTAKEEIDLSLANFKTKVDEAQTEAARAAGAAKLRNSCGIQFESFNRISRPVQSS